MEQLPPLHDGVPLFGLHAEPQPPQFGTEVLTLISQPSAFSPLQLPNPVRQVATVHWPVSQLGVAFGNAQ